jgi:hypothetical protein
VLLASSVGTQAGEHVFHWSGQPVPFVLEVSWGYDNGTAVATWPVNASNPASLPPPEALKNLTLEELLEILASTRPVSEAVIRVLQKRTKARQLNIELDPLKRFDSQAFLLRRTKRVAAALEGLRERLERPVLTEDAFEWRLQGPIGPIALAEAFVREASLPGEAKFYLAELALTLRRVDRKQAATGGLSAAVISELLLSTVRHLENRAAALPSTQETAMLDEYANAAFLEAVGQ